jgi:hypothetical protein
MQYLQYMQSRSMLKLNDLGIPEFSLDLPGSEEVIGSIPFTSTLLSFHVVFVIDERLVAKSLMSPSTFRQALQFFNTTCFT